MARNIWNWEQKKRPHFTYNEDALNALELKLSQNTGTVLGAFKHVNEKEKEQLIIDLALEVAPYFRIEKEEALQIIEKITSVVGNWKITANKYGLSRREQELKASAFE